MNRVEKEAFDAIERGDNIKIAAHLKPVLFGLFKGLNPNSSRDDGFSLLMEAAAKGNLEICKLLIEKGAGIDYATEEGFTALMAAAKFGHKHVCSYLLSIGANVNAKKTGKDSGWTALMFASSKGHKEIASVLLDHGADIKACTDSGWNSLMAASREGELETVDLLLQRGLAADSRTDDGFTALMSAVSNGQIDMAKYLIDKGADVNAVKTIESLKWSPLVFASRYGQTDAVKLLLEKGANVDHMTADHWTPLLWAAREGQQDICLALLEKGANIQYKSDDGDTALILAVFYGHLALTRFLLEQGADPFARNVDGKEIFMLAKEQGHAEILNYLRQNLKEPKTSKRSVNLVDGSTMSPSGSGGQSFQDAISSLNAQDYKKATDFFKLAIEEGLDALRMGYAYAHLGTIMVKEQNLGKAVGYFLKSLEGDEALYETAHEASQYLKHIYRHKNKNERAKFYSNLLEMTKEKLGYSPAPVVESEIKALLQRDKAKEPKMVEQPIDEVKKLIKANGLRPLGNRKRLLCQEGKSCYCYMALFSDQKSEEAYYRELNSYAKNDPPSIPFEIMVAYAPKSIYPQKFTVVFPDIGEDSSQAYFKWGRKALEHCNDVVRQDNYMAGGYENVHLNVETVIDWNIVLPRGFDVNSEDGHAVFADLEGAGFTPMKMAGQEGAKIHDKPSPLGPWIGIVFEISKFEEALYGRAATKVLTEIILKEDIAGSIVHAGDLLPECRYFCLAIRTHSQKNAEVITSSILSSQNPKLATEGKKFLTQEEIPLNALPFFGFFTEEGEYIGA